MKLIANPEFGTQVRFDPPVWFVPFPDEFTEALGISYCFDDDKVELLSFWIA